jgi:PIN domain nuclease of toxin-antitoxin system
VKVLLDTHTFLWFVLDDPDLSQAAKRVIEDSSNRILISPASYWEIAIKISVGKYRLNSTYEDFWRNGMLDNKFDVLHIELRHTARLLDLPLHHKDPFDRLVIAQSLAEDIPVVGRDPRFDSYGVERIW